MSSSRATVGSLLLAGTVLVSAPPDPTPTAVTETQRIKALPEEDRLWLTEFVAAILLPEEKKAFLDLTEPYQREFFKEDFWARRESPGLPAPLGPGYRDRYRELRQIVDERYDGWRNDAGRMILRWGEPASILKPRCGGEEVFHDIELWTYNNMGGSGLVTERYIFYRYIPNSPLRLWTPLDRNNDVFTQNSCRRSFADLRRDCYIDRNDRCGQCDDRCEIYKAYLEIAARQGSAAGALMEQARLFEPPRVSTEGVERQRERWAATSDPRAKKIHVEGPSSGAAREISPSVTPAPTPTPGPRRRLTSEEIAQQIERLEPKYKEWLLLARPLMTEQELSDFVQFSSREKDQYVRDYWKKHS